MSEPGLSTDDVRDVVVDHLYNTPERAAEEFDAWIAEIERAAAEKAWDRCVGEVPIDPYWKNFYGDSNPYRREETS